MVDYTAPIKTTFEFQRKSIQQSQKTLHQAVEAQQRFNDAVVDGIDSTESAQRRLVELQQQMFHDTLDALEANVPGADAATDDIREAVDEQYDELLANHEEAFDTLTAELDEGIGAYDELTGDYLDALEEQIALFLDAHEDFESQSVAAVEQLGEQVDELQDQAEEIQAQVQEVSEQAADVVEA